MILRTLLLVLFLLTSLTACNSSVEKAFDIATDNIDRKPINRDKLGVNAFFNEPGFGSIDAQYAEIKNTLGINFVRVLFAWDNNVQPSPGDSPNFSFFDDIIESIPPGVSVVVVLAHTPSWMSNSSNWIEGNPRKTWVERFLRKAVSRYAGTPGVLAWEIWNEPDLTTSDSDAALELAEPANYFELLSLGAHVVRTTDPTRIVLNAATSSINQDYPDILNYNKTLAALGATSIVDAWNIHYYGKQFERVVDGNGIAPFLNSLAKPIWVTESGAQGPNNQLAYVETAWPFLEEEIPGIDLFFYYNYASTDPLELNYGLRNNDSSSLVSDLYVHLRDG